MTLSWDLKISIGLFLAFFTFLVFNKRFRALLARLWKKAPNVYVLLERLNKDFEDSERVWVHADEDDGVVGAKAGEIVLCPFLLCRYSYSSTLV